MSKQTAVEWLVEKLNQCEPMYSGVQSNEHKEHLDKLIKQAKEMEEHHIINAFDAGVGSRKFLGEEYYEKTFKNETK